MKKKYKIKLRPILILIFVILIVLCCIRFFKKGHTISYRVGDSYEVKETYTKNVKGETDNYYIEIEVSNIPFGFQFYHTFTKKRKIVEEVITYQGDYICVLPIIGGEAITDLLCYQNYRYYFYHTIKGEDKDLDQFVQNLDVNIYDADDWEDASTDTIEQDNFSYYYRNKIENHILSLSSLKGVSIFDEDINSISLFTKDRYQRELSTYVSHYYVTADYNQTQQFRTFYFVDLQTGKVEEAKASNYISFDSYIEGIVDGKIYLYDRDNEKQYRISPSTKKIEEIGNNKKKIQYYENGNWSTISTTKANKTVLFSDNIQDSNFQKYDIVYHVGGEESGYYYLLLKTESGYQLYRTPSQNKKMITYITMIDDVEDLYFIQDYIYFQNGSKIQYYHDETGIRTILEYKELEFNQNLIFGVTEK